MKNVARASVSAVCVLLASAGMAAPPSLVLIGMPGEDISANGQTAVGAIYNAAIDRYMVARFTRGVGASITTGTFEDGTLTCSEDGSVLSFGSYNLENLGGLGADGYTPHRWTAGTGPVNLGTFADGNSCGQSINTANDTSGNGRYTVGAGWSGSECGPFRAWRYDAVAGAYEMLPFSTTPVPAANVRADSVSADGSVVCGYDENQYPGETFTTRRATVWTKSAGVWTQTILDEFGGEANAVSADGNVVVGKMSPEKMLAVFGTDVTSPVRWVRSGGIWVPQNLGGDGGNSGRIVSADGSTVVGSGGFFSGYPFIWRADLNGGVPMTQADYFASIGATFPGYTFGSFFGAPIQAISADATAILVNGFDDRNADCLSAGANGIVYVNGASCEPARINFGPVSQFDPAGPVFFGMTFNMFASGSWEVSYQWQKETPAGSGVWTTLSDDHCDQFDASGFNVKGSSTSQLRLGALDGTWPGRYRCIISNGCGGATGAPFKAGGCAADFNFDGFVTGDDFDAFVDAFEAGADAADFDDNGFVTGDDFDAFVTAFEAGC